MGKKLFKKLYFGGKKVIVIRNYIFFVLFSINRIFLVSGVRRGFGKK